MQVLRARTRVVNFRLTDQEYERLKHACEAQGWRSLSDFARAAVLGQADLPALGTTETTLLRLNRQLSQLDTRLCRVLMELNEKTR